MATQNINIPGGDVQDVTATAPILSSGGDNPDISIPKADASNDGYLSAADFVRFSAGSTGSVSSVAMTVPSFLNVSGSPITTSGTLAVTLATEVANIVFAGPASGGAATPTFRSLVATDIPLLSYVKTDGSTPLTGNWNAGSFQITAASFIPTSSTVPANGMYLSAANTVAFATNTTLAMSINASQNMTVVGTIGASNLSGTNSGDVTLAGENYLSIAAQVITANAVNLSGTNVTGNLGVTHLNSGTGASSSTFWRGDGTWASASGGITQLTADVTAGPGSGSQAATIAAIQGVAVSGTTGTTNVVFSASPTLSGTAIIPTITGATSGGSISINGGTATASGAGGNAVLQGASGGSTGAGGAGGNATLSGGNANGDNTQNNSGGTVSITGGASKGSSSGAGITLTSGTGGVGSSTAGATGGTTNVLGGTGGVGSSTSGNGGGATVKAGSGGNGVGGGNGGQAQLVGGTGGTGSGSGGNGGAVNVTGGSPGGFANAAGGSATLAGAGGSNTGAGGNGGSATITGADAGGDNTQNNSGGSITIKAGNSKGSSNGAAWTITGGTGGVGTSSTGATGGSANINAGPGGVGSATGGAGGDVKIAAGAGGNSGTPGAGGNIIFSTGSTISVAEHLRVSNSGDTQLTSGNLNVLTAGFGLTIKSGSNCKTGTATLSGGTVTVSNTAVTANSNIFVTVQSLGTVVVPTAVCVTAKTANTSFVITSASATDTSVVAWMIVERG